MEKSRKCLRLHNYTEGATKSSTRERKHVPYSLCTVQAYLCGLFDEIHILIIDFGKEHDKVINIFNELNMSGHLKILFTR